jgi:hypothetical protein
LRRPGFFALQALVIVAVLAASGCGKSDRSFDDAPPTGTFVGQDGGPGARPTECAEDTKDIFVVTDQALLYQFHPPTLSFKNIGRITCASGGATPTSMAVDRFGIAYVRHSDGSIWKVSTKDLSCEQTSFDSTTAVFDKFGMGFASELKGTSAESLYIADHSGGGLARLDTKTLQSKYIGAWGQNLDGMAAELTGNGDGKLYGFFTTTPAQVAEISKGTGGVMSTKELTGVNAGNAWAFSFYGGDFYIYTAAGPNPTGPPLADGGSNVTRYRPSDGSVEIVMKNIGFTIVGAGVSTCAPTTLPR